jgi:hypothetical protein
MNGPTEAILDELLKNAKDQTKILERLAKEFKPQSGGGSSAGGGIGDVVRNMGPLAKAASMAANVFGGLVSIVGAVVGGFADITSRMYDFAKATSDGTASLSKYYKIFDQLPLGIGKLFGLLVDVTEYREKLLESYRSISQSGLDTGGSLSGLTEYAIRTGLSLQELQKAAADNSTTFASLGGNVTDGFKKYASVQAGMLKDNEAQIFSMGFTAATASDSIMTMIKGQGAMGRAGAATQQQLTQYSLEYMTQLDALTKITGQRREQIDAEVKKAEEEQLWQTFKDSLSPEEAAKVTEQLMIAQQLGGKALVDVVKNQLRGIDAPLDEASTNMAITSNGMSVQLGALTRRVMSSRASMEDFMVGIKGVADRSLATANQMGRGIVFNQAMYSSQQQLIATARNYQNILDATNKALAEHKKAVGGDAQALATAEQNVKNLGMGLMNRFTLLIDKFREPLGRIAGTLFNWVETILQSPVLENAVKGLVAMLNYTLDAFSRIGKAFLDGGIGKGFQQLWSELKNAGTEIWKVIGPPFMKFWDQTLFPWLKDGFSNLFEMLADAINRKFNPFAESEATYRDRTKAEALDKTAISNLTDTRAQDWAAYQKNMNDNLLKAAQQSGTVAYTMPKDMIYRLWVEDWNKRQAEIAESRATVQPAPPAKATGSLGTTGKLFEDWGSGTLAELHGTESVMTPDQMTKLIMGAGHNDLATGIKQLNNLTTQLLSYMKQTAENTRNTHDATKALNGNLFEAI